MVTRPETTRPLEQRLYLALLKTMLHRSKYLRLTGRLTDPQSDGDIAYLEMLLDRALETVNGNQPEPDVPATIDQRLFLARAQELGRYREVVCSDSELLRAASSELVDACEAARLSRRTKRQLQIVRRDAGRFNLEQARALFGGQVAVE